MKNQDSGISNVLERYIELKQLLAELQQVPAEHGLTFERVVILYSIKQSQPVLVSKLAKILESSKPNISRQLNCLMADGLIKKQRLTDADQRLVEITLTSKGQTILETIESTYENYYSQGGTHSNVKSV